MMITLPIIGGVVAIKKILKKEFVKFNLIYLIGIIIGAVHTAGGLAIEFTSGWVGAYSLCATLPLIFLGRYKHKTMGLFLIVNLIIYCILNYQAGEMNKYFLPTLIIVEFPMLAYGVFYIKYGDKLTQP